MLTAPVARTFHCAPVLPVGDEHHVEAVTADSQATAADCAQPSLPCPHLSYTQKANTTAEQAQVGRMRSQVLGY